MPVLVIVNSCTAMSLRFPTYSCKIMRIHAVWNQSEKRGVPPGVGTARSWFVFTGGGVKSDGTLVGQDSPLHQADGQNMQSSAYWTIERSFVKDRLFDAQERS